MHDNFPRLYSRFTDTTYFRHAFEAVSLALLARATHMSTAYSLQAQSLYGKAVRQLRLALNNDAACSSATALMSTELLTQYDVREISNDHYTVSTC